MESSNHEPPINVIEKYHSDIEKAWEMVKKEPKLKEICELEAFAQDTLYKNGLLFLGVGASNGKKENKKGEKKENTCDLTHRPVQYETDEGRNKHSYYQPMRKLADETGFGKYWSNIDITLFRETNQSIVESLFIDPSLKDIMQKQLDLATKMIKAVKPKIIIVSNTLVRKIFRVDIFLEREEKKFKSEVRSDFCFNTEEKVIDEYGTPLISSKDKEIKEIPVFFSSMLSGQRALDLGSFKRLKWHIEFVKRQIKI